MHRDWNLIRLILAKLEQKASTKGVLHPGQVSGYDEETVSYHLHLLQQAGLIEATCRSHRNAPVFCLARNLTWSGHELLEQIRSDTAWNRIGAHAKERGLGLSFEVIQQIAAQIAATVMS